MDAAIHSPLLVNALGHLAGAVAFAALLVLLGRGSRLGGRSQFSTTAAAAGLAFLWNLGSLYVLLAPPESRTREVVASLSFAVLSMLPGVLLHLALGEQYRWLRVFGYAAGAAAAALHVLEVFGVEVGSHELALNVVTYGFGAIAVAFALLLIRSQADDRRAAARASAAMSLFLLAASFVHFDVEPGPASWTHELIFHHAAIPLALFVLLQDHRFLLLDAFVRWLGTALLAGGLAGGILAGLWGLGWLRIEDAGAVGPAAAGAAIALAIVLYPGVRDRIGDWVEPALFRRGDVAAAAERIRSLEDSAERPYVERAAELIADFASARRWELETVERDSPPTSVEALDPRPSDQPWAEVVVALRVSPGRSRVLRLGVREGGRRFLGADLDDLTRLAEEASIRMEALRRAEQQRLLAGAELQALRAQINPHFLFNALNALYGAIPRSAPEARKTLLDLSEILRYSLDGKRQYVALEEELRVVEAYLAVERLRLQERLTVRIACDEAARTARIPAFTIQPLVENAVKHGISGLPKGGTIDVAIRAAGDALTVEVADDGAGFDARTPSQTGHGLHNVQRRLELCYGDAARFAIESSSAGTAVRFAIPRSPVETPPNESDPARTAPGAY